MHAGRRLSGPLIVILTIALVAAVVSAGQLAERRFAGSIEHPAIEYATRPAREPRHADRLTARRPASWSSSRRRTCATCARS